MCLGVPGQIVEISDVADLRGTVAIDGVHQQVSLAMLGVGGPDGARVGDWVVVHVGFAMTKIDESEARELQSSLRELHEMYERELADSPPDLEQVTPPAAAPGRPGGGR